MPAQPWTADLRKISDQDEIARIRRLAEQFQRSLSGEFLSAIERLRERIDLAQIRRLLEAGQIAQAIAVVSEAAVANAMGPFAQAVAAATVGAGQSAAAVIGAYRHLHNLDVVFNSTNPGLVRHLETYRMDLIRELTDQARYNVQRVITEGASAGKGPRDVAREVRQHIGLTRAQSRYVSNYRLQLEQLDVGALQRQLRDRRFDGVVARAIEGQTPLTREKIDQLVARYEARWLKHRSETIARTEAIRAANTGNQEAWRQANEQRMFEGGTVIRQWVYTHDDRTRSWHRNIPSLNPRGVGLEQPFQTDLGPIMYPGDPNAPAANTINCRCTMVIKYVPSWQD